jgi:hypothetical protein
MKQLLSYNQTFANFDIIHVIEFILRTSKLIENISVEFEQGHIIKDKI